MACNVHYRQFTDFRPKLEILAETRPTRRMSALPRGTRQLCTDGARAHSLFVFAHKPPPSTPRGPPIYAAQLSIKRCRPTRGLRQDESKHHMTTNRGGAGYKSPRARRGGGRGREERSKGHKTYYSTEYYSVPITIIPRTRPPVREPPSYLQECTI